MPGHGGQEVGRSMPCRARSSTARHGGGAGDVAEEGDLTEGVAGAEVADVLTVDAHGGCPALDDPEPIAGIPCSITVAPAGTVFGMRASASRSPRHRWQDGKHRDLVEQSEPGRREHGGVEVAQPRDAPPVPAPWH